MRKIGLLLMGLACVLPAWPQMRVDGVHSVDPSAMYSRIYAIVPLIGSGTKADPKRPMFISASAVTPASPSSASTASATATQTQPHNGILAYQMQVSDNGQFALVEFVGADPVQLRTLIDPTVPGVQVFERGKATPAQILAAFQQYKQGFQFSWFGMRPE